ncbi:MAG: MutT/nudix family protein [Francisellaceae bacterium]|nr:MutT/nudix family protein [Francisellaceae bacterium]
MNQNNIHVLSRALVRDNEYILLCQTLDLTDNFYFLPGGHIEHGESAKSALIRELKEETGYDFKIKRFLGCLEYGFQPGHSSICHNHEYNFIFEVEAEELNSKTLIPKLEPHIELVWLPISQVATIDFKAEPLKELISKWLKVNMDQALYSDMQALEKKNL